MDDTLVTTAEAPAALGEPRSLKHRKERAEGERLRSAERAAGAQKPGAFELFAVA